MNIEKINLLREFCKWVRENTNKSAIIDIKFWQFSCENKESIEYQLYVSNLINKSSNNIDVLVNLIPKFKLMCELNMEVAA